MPDARATVALVSGATSGIGRAVALGLAASSAGVVLAGRRVDRLDAVAAGVDGLGAESLAVATDVSSPVDAQRAVDAAIDRFGRLDVLVNCAGVMLAGGAQELSADAAGRMFGVNVLGTMNLTRAAVPHLRAAAQRAPRFVADIVNLSSIVARSVRADLGGYCASKGAVEAYSEACRRELAPAGVRVCTLIPGSVETELLGHSDAAQQASLRTAVMRRLAPEDISAAVLWAIARPGAAAVTMLEIRPIGQV